jgi:hypothetical protein
MLAVLECLRQRQISEDGPLKEEMLGNQRIGVDRLPGAAQKLWNELSGTKIKLMTRRGEHCQHVEAK